MDWTAILAAAQVPDSPGRHQAVLAARAFSQKRQAAKQLPAAERPSTRKPARTSRRRTK